MTQKPILSSDYVISLHKGLEILPSGARRLAEQILLTWKEDKRIYVAGNGGASAIASHFVNDLRKYVPGGLSAFCLSDNVPVLTAIANDKGYEHVFRDALLLDAEPGDLFIALSCSGNSQNIVNATGVAHGTLNMRLVGITGHSDSRLAEVISSAIVEERAMYLLVPHPDIRGQEDLMMILCHLAVGEVARAMWYEEK